MLTALQARTPRVEADADREGVLWLDPSGLSNLFGPLERWAKNVHDALLELSLSASIVVGFARLPCWAIARCAPGAVVVLTSAADEAFLRHRDRTSLEHRDHAHLARARLTSVEACVCAGSSIFAMRPSTLLSAPSEMRNPKTSLANETASRRLIW